MDKSSNLALKLVLGSIFVVQFLLGAAGLLSGKVVIKAVAIFYGASLTTTPQVDYIVRMLGAYIISIAFLALFALLDPKRNKAIINGLIILMLLRFLEVLIFARQVHEAFSISMGKFGLMERYF